jgi:hypothetical protein
MRRKSMKEVIAPEEGRDTLAGMNRAIAHATHMHRTGQLSDKERDDFAKLAMSELLEHSSMEDFDRMLQNGDFERIREQAGYRDDEDPDEVDDRRQAVAAKVAVNLFADAAQRGLIDPKEAIEAIRAYADVPDDDDHEATIMNLLTDSSEPDKRLPAPGENQMTDEEIEAAIDGLYGKESARPRVEPEARVVNMPSGSRRRIRNDDKLSG